MIDLPPMDLVKAEAATLLDSFAAVHLIGFFGKDGRPAGGNFVMLASDRPMPSSVRSTAAGTFTVGRDEVERFAADSQILRDDYAPVDQLLTIDR
jgi:hypothetical protein